MDCRLQTVDGGLWTADCGLWEKGDVWGRGVKTDLSKAGRVKTGRVIQLGGQVIAAVLADSLIWLVRQVSWLMRQI